MFAAVSKRGISLRFRFHGRHDLPDVACSLKPALDDIDRRAKEGTGEREGEREKEGEGEGQGGTCKRVEAGNGNNMAAGGSP